MLKEKKVGAVTQIMMGREVDGTVYYWTAAYLVDGLLIDTGCSFTAPELIAFLRDKTVNQVINTHHHEDHVGGNSLVQKEYGLDIYAHPLAVSLIGKKMELHQYQELVWGYPEPTMIKTIGDQIKTEHFIFQVINTPGHCPGSICVYWRGRKALFTGDLIFNKGIGRTDLPGGDSAVLKASIRRLRDLDVEYLMPGHGEIISGASAVRENFDHLERVWFPML